MLHSLTLWRCLRLALVCLRVISLANGTDIPIQDTTEISMIISSSTGEQTTLWTTLKDPSRLQGGSESSNTDKLDWDSETTFRSPEMNTQMMNHSHNCVSSEPFLCAFDNCSQSDILCTPDNDTESELTPHRHDTHVTTSRSVDVGDKLFSKEDAALLRDLRNKIGLPCSLVGCFLNVLSIIVYYRIGLSVVNTYLIGIQVVCLLFLICTLYPFLAKFIAGGPVIGTPFYLHYAIWGTGFLYNSLHKANTVLNGILSLNRCVVLLAPFKSSYQKVFSYPKLTIIAVTAITMVCSIHVCLRLEVKTSNRTDGSTFTYLTKSDHFKQNPDFFKNMSWAASFLFTYIPSLITFIANTVLVVALIKYSRAKHRLHKDGTNDSAENNQFFKMSSQKTIVVIGYSLVSLVLLSPYICHQVINVVVPAYDVNGPHHYLFVSMPYIFALLDIFRSAVGFFVFLALSTAFRKELLAFLSCKPALGKARGSSKLRSTQASHK